MAKPGMDKLSAENEEAPGTHPAFRQGMELYNQGNFQAALPCFLRALEADNQEHQENKQVLFKDYRMLGEVYLKLGDYTAALEYYSEALRVPGKENSKTEETAGILAGMGRIHYYLGDQDKATAYFREAAACTEIIESLELKAGIYHFLGILSSAKAQYDAAIGYFREAINFASLPDLVKQRARSHEALGDLYFALYKQEETLVHYREALQLYQEGGYAEDTAYIYERIGRTYYAYDKYQEALENYQDALAIADKYNSREVLQGCYYGIGSVLYIQGDYRQTLEYYKKGIVLAEESGDREFLSTLLLGAGIVYTVWGEYAVAVTYMEKALTLARELQAPNIPDILLNITNIYRSWGYYAKAWEYLREAYTIILHNRDVRNQCIALYYMGDLSALAGENAKAAGYYKESLNLAETYDFPVYIINNLSRLGMEMAKRKNYGEAVKSYNAALDLAEKIANISMMARVYIDLGTLYYDQEQYRTALEYYQKAAEVNTHYDITEHYNTDMYYLGAACYKLGDYKRAGEYLVKGIEIIEKLRETAKGVIRWDYLESQIYTYRKLIAAYIMDNEPVKAFDTIELVSAKYLKEQLGAKTAEKIAPASVTAYRKQIPAHQVVLSYMNLEEEGIGIVAVTGNAITARLVPAGEIPGLPAGGYAGDGIQDISRTIIKAPVNAGKSENLLMEGSRLSTVISSYRQLLTSPLAGKKEKEKMQALGNHLYNLCIFPVADILKDKTELLIIPGGITGLIPFEALVTGTGQYLVEEFHIQYAHTLAVSAYTGAREYADNRKDILAFGGAMYDRDIPGKPETVEPVPGPGLKNDLLLSLDRGTPPETVYAALGITHWSNLPGTYAEVKSIEGIFSDSLVYTGQQVTEKQLKSLSATGALQQFRILHFATHAMVIPEVPQLSALIFSQDADLANEEDNYLTMEEIGGLDIKADFVNLSACDTGLGKIYNGEGIIGFTQAFLIAGANGLSVSLWKINDLSTNVFMTGMYKLYKEKHIPFNYALTEMKRSFIAGKTYAHPFYWAAFVYYGSCIPSPVRQ